MSYRYEKESGDIVVEGFENGIQPSPHRGIANIQNANISTEMGEVMNSFARVQQSMTDTATTGTLSYLATDHVNLSITGSNNLFKGNWITVTNSSNTTQLPNATYYVPLSTGAGFELTNYYNTTNAIGSALVVGGGAGGGVGGTYQGGGGGAGQVNPQSSIAITPGSYTITVGAGGNGAASSASKGSSGSSSSFGSLVTATGGGGGGSLNAADLNGANGASGGGGTVDGSDNVGTGGTGSAGNNGGSGHTGSGVGGNRAGGGGGGAGGVGQVGTSAVGGVGGAGVSSSISGGALSYGGGGGGGSTTGGTASAGGGAGGSAGVGNAATANTGGGGGGGGTTGGNGASGIVIISIPTVYGVTATGGTHTTSGGNDIWTFTTSGTWVPTIPTNRILSGFTGGLTATIQLTAVMGKPLAQAIETYYQGGIVYHRYYILDNQNLVWVYDDYNDTIYSSSDGVAWFLPDLQTAALPTATGITVISGFLIATTTSGLYSKPTTILGNTNSTSTTWVQFTDLQIWSGSESASTPHYAFAGHQGAAYITDGSYIVSVFPNATLADPGNSTSQNVQSFCSWTVLSPTTTGTYTLISGTTPIPDDNKRVPVVFFTPNQGSLPSAISANTVYYLAVGGNAFTVYAASTGGSAINISAGLIGTQYFNTFYPYGATASASTGATPTYVLTNPQVALPVFEVAQCIAEIGTTILIGCQSNIVYPWNQQVTQASSIISLPENNVTNIITVNQMGYIFAGNKGNIYITDGSVASLVSTVPDYCAGIAGTPSTYVEPVFVWGGGAYIRGRVYFSVLDQTASKVGNCGGIWSFVPTQNFYIGQDVGIALRLENQSSYGTYNGYSPLIIPKYNQAVSSPQFWNAWENSITSSIYGIDFTGTGSSSTSPVIIETDAIPTGTMLNRKSFEQIELKFTTPLLTADSVSLKYRKDITSAWTSVGTARIDNNRLSVYFPAGFEKTQWLQLQSILTAGTSTSFIRLSQIRIR